MPINDFPTHKRMINGQSTYRSFEILRSVPPLRMTASSLVVVGKRRRRSRLLLLATECHPERSEESRQEFAQLNNP
jgi:hypothetical protein